MSACKLTYFDCHALGEAVRLLLSYGKIEFENIRVNSDKDWPSYPKDTLPLRMLPILEIDGQVLHQSIAICRYLGKRVGLAGTTTLEDYEIDSVVDTVNDFRGRLAGAHYERNAEAKAEKVRILEAETIPFFANKLDAIVQQNNGHLALKKLTWADAYLAGISRYLITMAGSDFTANYPNLRKAIDNTESTPGFKEWIATRPDDLL